MPKKQEKNINLNDLHNAIIDLSKKSATKKDLSKLELRINKNADKKIESLAVMINKHFATKNDLQDMKHEILEATKSTRNETLSFKDHIASRVSDLEQESAMDKEFHDRTEDSINNHEKRITSLEQARPRAFAQ